MSSTPQSSISLSEVSPADRFEAWRQQISPLFDLELVEAASHPTCDVNLAAAELGDVLVSRLDLVATAHRGLRSPQKIRREPLDHVVIEAYLDGGCVGEADGADFVLEAGSVGVFDLARPLSVQSAAGRSIAVTAPRTLFEREGLDAAKLHGAVLRGGMAKLVGDYLLALQERACSLDWEEAAQAGAATAAMLQACLAPTARNLGRARRPLQDVLRRRAMRYIDANHSSPQLSVDGLCVALKVSRSHLYRAFEAHGGVAAYIQDRRLLKARAALLNPADRRLVSEVAYDMGFVSAAHFSRVFREKFGRAPSEFRAGRIVDMQPAPDGESTIRNWLRRLDSRASVRLTPT